MTTNPHDEPDLRNEPAPPRNPDAGDEATGTPSRTTSERVRQTAQDRRDAAEDEEVDIWEGGYSPRAMVGAWILAAVVAIGIVIASVLAEPFAIPIGIGIALAVLVLVGLLYAYRRMSIYYRLTNQRFIHQSGILKRVTDRIEVIDIDDVAYEQGPVQRMFGVGTIRIDSSDKSHPTLTMTGIGNVQEVAGLIDDIRRKERRRRSLHIEAI